MAGSDTGNDGSAAVEGRLPQGWEHERLEAKIDRALRMSYSERYREMVEFADFIQAARARVGRTELDSREERNGSAFRSIQILRASPG